MSESLLCIFNQTFKGPLLLHTFITIILLIVFREHCAHAPIWAKCQIIVYPPFFISSGTHLKAERSVLFIMTV